MNSGMNLHQRLHILSLAILPATHELDRRIYSGKKRQSLGTSSTAVRSLSAPARAPMGISMKMKTRSNTRNPRYSQAYLDLLMKEVVALRKQTMAIDLSLKENKSVLAGNRPARARAHPRALHHPR